MSNPISRFAKRRRITSGEGFSLKDYATDDKGGVQMTKAESGAALRERIEAIAEQQGRLYASGHWSVLCIFQAQDAAGKDSAIKHVFSGINPQGCQVATFSAPVGLEREHDFLWRHVVALPRRGRIGIHNRSWYEEVLVARVHPGILDGQLLPPVLVESTIWDERLEDIACFERYLSRQGTVLLKFFLHLGEEEQRKRFLARIDEPDKNWKLHPSDIVDRRRWHDYQAAYEAAIRATASPHAPWYVLPADRKWLTRLLVAETLLETLRKLDLRYPEVSETQRESLQKARKALS
ncbi:polyphosphate kinase 2 family protein [Roseomonas gilardii subsp. gilardii]|uniref:PPK2 family polyphosphate kinase n=1 Tax=Roseomonas gilardii TaxID=257708 RepID=UPI001FFB8698|nr:PPK2 family polyphosphate kinase [Roseomonas gilardii]UPG70978.1 polyphosphate kinase 2 family protein [Roseomonas gilardii subsp. gilardii]